MSHVELTLWAALLIGLIFGANGQATGFCLYRGLRNVWTGHSADKLRAFGLALAIALLGTQLLAWVGLIDLSQSIYVNPSFSWLLIPIGGVIFGYGMTLANGCGARALVLLGQGNLRSFVVLLCLGIAAFITLTGLLATTRMDIANATPIAAPGLHGLAPEARVLFAVLVSAALAYFVFRKSSFLRNRTDLLGGVVAGVVIVAGWVATGIVGYDDFEPVALTSVTFVSPVGETIQYAMIATGMKLSFGIVVVVGVVVGSLIMALARGKFHLEGFSTPQMLLRYMAGGALMGVGGALAMGCSIGQGLTGLSTLGTSSMIAAAGIIIGTRLAITSPLRVPDLSLPKRVGDI